MIGIRAWAAWSPEVSDPEGWRAWARAPRALASGGPPEVRFLPALQRRRCDGLSRMMLHVVEACCDEELRGQVASVFASRHGPFATTVSLLEHLAVDDPVSPAQFSHSVHNAPAGLFSIWAQNPWPSVSLSGASETFASAFLEARCALYRAGDRPVLLVVADEGCPDAVAHLDELQHGPYAIALLLETEESARAVTLERRTVGRAPRPLWPDGLEFLRWWLSDEGQLELGRWQWARGHT